MPSKHTWPVSPQIKLLYGIMSKAAISMTFNLQCKAKAALFFIPYRRPSLRTLPILSVANTAAKPWNWATFDVGAAVC